MVQEMGTNDYLFAAFFLLGHRLRYRVILICNRLRLD